MKKVFLETAVSDHELASANVNLMKWVVDRLLTEMYHKWPVKNETVQTQRDHIRFQEIVSVSGEWKEPIQ